MALGPCVMWIYYFIYLFLKNFVYCNHNLLAKLYLILLLRLLVLDTFKSCNSPSFSPTEEDAQQTDKNCQQQKTSEGATQNDHQIWKSESYQVKSKRCLPNYIAANVRQFPHSRWLYLNQQM